MRYSFVFVCQGGVLEREAALLAASLNQNIQVDCELIAAIPDYGTLHLPSRETIDFLEFLNVRIVRIDNTIDRSYPIAHKIECFNIDVSGETLVFLDSDVICFSELGDEFFRPECHIEARLTDFCDLSIEEWQTIYDRFMGRNPDPCYYSLATREAMPLSLNSGIVVCRKPKDLYRAWSKMARRLNDPKSIPKTRPFLDQISLSLVVQELDWDIHLLSQQDHFSLPVAMLELQRPPTFVHYYEHIHLLGDAALSAYVTGLQSSYPALQTLLAGDPDFSLLTREQFS